MVFICPKEREKENPFDCFFLNVQSIKKRCTFAALKYSKKIYGSISIQ
ncbi:MAG: hypothetical protein H6Q13_2123 [Bacteroidetes bacterium]|jgi:hypothetical protein|nr:hypothetical protein [Bacteroidota bacterium]